MNYGASVELVRDTMRKSTTSPFLALWEIAKKNITHAAEIPYSIKFLGSVIGLDEAVCEYVESLDNEYSSVPGPQRAHLIAYRLGDSNIII